RPQDITHFRTHSIVNHRSTSTLKSRKGAPSTWPNFNHKVLLGNRHNLPPATTENDESARHEWPGDGERAQSPACPNNPKFLFSFERSVKAIVFADRLSLWSQ